MAGQSQSSKRRTVKRAVLSHSRQIYSYVKVDELIPEFVHPELSFLTTDEIERLRGISYGDSEKARELLVILKKKNSLANSKFVACLMLEPEHSGHQQLAKELMSGIPENGKKIIKKIISNYKMAVKGNIEHPLAPIKLHGCLKGSHYEKLDCRLWSYLQSRQYDSLYKLTKRMRERTDVVDYQIVAMWFESVVYIHGDKDHEKCITDLLKPALELCKVSNVTNQTILEGRVHQRMSQILLILGKNEEAVEHFHMAEHCLQFVGRGYDKVQLLLRHAKILSSMSSPSDDQRLEMLYSSALDCISDDDPFAFTCRPSLYLSKAAFHLGIAFGSKPSPMVEPSDNISPDNIKKAREALSAVSSEEIRPVVVRECEKSLVNAELLRLDKNVSDALKEFEYVKKTSIQTGLNNLFYIAEHRVRYLEQEQKKGELIDELLEGLP